MGYFSNGTEVGAYMATYCNRCIHGQGDDLAGCPVMNAHQDCSESQMSRRTSYLHTFIPRTADGRNGQCNMFVPAPTIVNTEDVPKPESKYLHSMGKLKRKE